MTAVLVGDFSALPPGERNVVWRFFTDPSARDRHDLDGGRRFARESVADLRAAAARYPRDTGTHKRLHHPLVGWLDLDCEALHDPHRDQWIVLYTAAPGTPSHEAL